MNIRIVQPLAVIAAILLACLVGCESVPPKTVPEVFLRAFERRFDEPIEIVSRKYKFAPPWSIHGVWYWEDTVVRLSANEYSRMVTHALATGQFKTREFSDHVVFDRDLPKWRISWSGDEKEHTISYHYSEQ